MLKKLEKILFPLIIIQMMLSSLNWEVLLGFEIYIPIIAFWVIIAFSFFIVYNSQYRVLGILLFFLMIGTKLIEIVYPLQILDILGKLFVGMFFLMSGAKIYGNNLKLIHKQLVVFLMLSIPILFLQKIGAHYLFMGWSQDHDAILVTTNELGTFKKIQLYPTLFVDSAHLTYLSFQARPSGLLYNNNIFGAFVSIAIGLNFILEKKNRIRYSDVIVTIAAILTSSLLVFGVLLITYLTFIIAGSRLFRKRAFNLLTLMILVGIGYWILFPGLTESFFSIGKFYASLFSRLFDITDALNIGGLRSFFGGQTYILGRKYVIDINESYSGISMLIKSGLIIPILFGLLLLGRSFMFRLKSFKKTSIYPPEAYVTLLLMCILTQFAISLLTAFSFYLFIGISLFPLFSKYWKVNT